MIKRIVTTVITLFINAWVLYDCLQGDNGYFNKVTLLLYLAIPVYTVLEQLSPENGSMGRKIGFVFSGLVTIGIMYWYYSSHTLTKENGLITTLLATFVLSLIVVLFYIGVDSPDSPRRSTIQLILAIVAGKVLWYNRYLLSVTDIEGNIEIVSIMFCLVLVGILFIDWLQFSKKVTAGPALGAGAGALIVGLIIFFVAKNSYVLYSNNFYISSSVAAISYGWFISIYESAKKKE